MASRKGYKEIQRQFGKPDIVHLNVAYPAGILALALKHTRRLKYIITEHWTGYTKNNDLFSKYPCITRRLIKYIFKQSDAVTAVSCRLADSLREQGLLDRRCNVVHNAIDIPEGKYNAKKPDGFIDILTVSILFDRQKNISGLIDAFGEIARKEKDVRLHIIGDGEDRAVLENRAAELGLLNEKIFFHGYVPNEELGRHYGEADFFVLSSNYETFSVVTAEALAHGIPVVTTRCGGPEEFVNDRVGLLVEKENKDSLVRGLEYMIENCSNYDPREIGDYARERFSRETIGAKFNDIYDEVLNSGRVPAK